MIDADGNGTTADFVWKDGERLIAFGQSAMASLPQFMRAAGIEQFVLLVSERARGHASELEGQAEEVLTVEHGRVDKLAGNLVDRVGNRPVFGFGGGRVIDTAKAIGSANAQPVAAFPTTLSGAPMTPFHRLPAGDRSSASQVRPQLVIAVPELMASQPPQLRAGSVMNALSHAIESIFVTTSSPVPRLTAKGAIELLYGGLIGRGLGVPGAEPSERIRGEKLALGAIEAGYAVGATGYAIHHAVCQSIVRIGDVPHAPTYGVMLPYSLEFLRIRDEQAWEMVSNAIGDPDPSLAIARACAAAGLPTTLRDLGVAEERIDAIAAAAAERPQLRLTPGGAGLEDVRQLLASAF